MAKPKSNNKYLAHLWSHFVLPFKNGDVLFCPANTAPIFVPKNKKLVVTIHDVAFITHPKSFSTFFRIYYKLIMPIIIKRANKIITISHFSKQEIVKYYPDAKNKIEVIHLGLDEKYRIIQKTQKENQILYVGSLNERKNFKAVLKAFYRMQINCKLLVVGNFSSNFVLDDESLSLIKEAKKNDNIVFKSNVTDEELVDIYNASKLFLFPSFYEGFGFPPLEAMACGTPVITSNVSSMPEVCGDAALYVDPHNIDDITSKIELLLSDEALQHSMIEKGLLHVKQFRWEKAAKEHLKILQSVLN